MKMPNTREKAIALIEAAGHSIRVNGTVDLLDFVEWGDTPCSGPQCQKCGDVWCLWEDWIEIHPCA